MFDNGGRPADGPLEGLLLVEWISECVVGARNWLLAIHLRLISQNLGKKNIFSTFCQPNLNPSDPTIQQNIVSVTHREALELLQQMTSMKVTWWPADAIHWGRINHPQVIGSGIRLTMFTTWGFPNIGLPPIIKVIWLWLSIETCRRGNSQTLGHLHIILCKSSCCESDLPRTSSYGNRASHDRTRSIWDWSVTRWCASSLAKLVYKYRLKKDYDLW